MKAGVNLVMVLDGERPPEKKAELERRAIARGTLNIPFISAFEMMNNIQNMY